MHRVLVPAARAMGHTTTGVLKALKQGVTAVLKDLKTLTSKAYGAMVHCVHAACNLVQRSMQQVRAWLARPYHKQESSVVTEA